jgi:GNAT superfamily N-acetyltransferase
VARVWDRAAPLVARAIERGVGAGFSDVERDVLEGDALLWFAWSNKIEGVAVTQVLFEGDDRVCTLVAVAAVTPWRNWRHLLEGLEQYARDMGCVKICIRGRKGWKRLLSDYHEPPYIVLEKELT